MSLIKSDGISSLQNTPVRRNTTESNLSHCSRILAPPENSNLTRRFTSDAVNPGTPECFSVIQLPVSSGPGSPYVKNAYGDEGDQSSLTVAVRVRPFNQRELAHPDLCCIISMKDKETTVKTSSNNEYKYTYDFSFWSFDKDDVEFASQEHVYKSLAQPLLVKAFQGYNTSLFAYGQTGSGKSYSIMGYGKEEGIVPRFSRELFERIKITSEKYAAKSSVEISFFEIYNEKIHDLLESKKDKRAKKTALKVREHPILGPYIEGLSTHMVNSFEDIECWINLGNKNRATAATGMNDKSSRSHSIFTMVLTQTKAQEIDGQKHDHSTTSKINLVDLAGSERQSTSQSSGERFREGININKSLMTLGKVISLLSEISSNGSKKKIFIPYRDSILTWLLKESLGGNSRTAMIATVSPANCHAEETLSTLRYAQQARFIVNRVRINEDTKTKKIQELMAEIKKLKSTKNERNIQVASLDEIAALRTELEKKEKELSETKRTLEEKLSESEKKKREQFQILQHSGIAFKIDNTLPHLVNLSKDPQLSEVLLYLLKEGETNIGQKKSNTHDIQLTSALIADYHCIINNCGNVVTIKPVEAASTYVNGNLITMVTNLSHGDTVILGGDHFFRFVNPSESEKKDSSQELKDFDFAYSELIKKQEKRLAEELDEVKKQVQLDMIQQIDEEKNRTEELLQKQKSGYEVQLANLQDVLNEKNSLMKISELENKELAEKIKKQKQELDVKLLAEKQRQKEILQITETISSQKQADDVLLKSLQKVRDDAENNLKKLQLHLHETLNGSSSSASMKSEDQNILQSPSSVYQQTMLTINSLMNLVEDVNSQDRQSIEEIKNKQQSLTKEMFDTYQSQQEKHSSAGIYQTYLAILEANAICRHLKKNINGDDSVEAVFADEQFWENDDDWLTFTMNSDIQGLPVILASPKHVRSNFRRFSSPGFSANKPSRVIESYGNINFSSYVSILASICQQTSTFLKQEQQFDWTFADQIWAGFCEIICSVKTVIRIWPENQLTVMANPSEDELCKELAFLLHKSYSLSSNNKLLMKTLRQENAYVQSICRDMTSFVEQISEEITSFLLSCNSKLSRNIQDNGRRIVISIQRALEVFAKLILVTNQKLVLFQDENSEIIDLNICKLFKNYCDDVVENIFKGALHSLNEWEVLSHFYTTNNLIQVEIWKDIEILISIIKTLLENNKCSFIHQNDKVDTLTVQFYKFSFKDSKEICFLVKNLVENVASIMLSLKSSSNESVKNILSLFDTISNLSQELCSFANQSKSVSNGQTDTPKATACLPADQQVSADLNNLTSIIDKLKLSVIGS